MFEVTNILFPTDLSIICGAFAWQVMRLTERFDANLTLLHIEKQGKQNSLEAPRFADFTHLFAEQVDKRKFSRMMLAGDVVTNIVDHANTEEVDLIMMPTEAGGIRQFLSQSKLERTLRNCSCAVWTAKGQHAAACPQFRNIVCAVDLNSDTPRILRTARKLTEQLGGNLFVVHVMPHWDESILHLVAAHDLPAVASGKAAMDTMSSLQQAGLMAEFQVECDDLIPGAKRLLQRLRADLLVIGPGRGSGKNGRLGTNVLPLIRMAPCPVFVVEKAQEFRQLN